MGVTIRRAGLDDVDFLADLFTHEEIAPFLAAVRASTRADVQAAVERSLAEPDAFGVFVIDVDAERAGSMSFELVNRRSRIASLEGLAVHPRFRGRHVADEAAHLFQRLLLGELGLHRLQLEIYGFNESAMRHAERAGFVREGVRRKAYWRRETWVDGVLYGLVAEDQTAP